MASIEKLTEDEQKAIGGEMSTLYRKLADMRSMSAESAKPQTAMKDWYVLLNLTGSYSLEAFNELCQLYAKDPRIVKNIKPYGEELSVFLHDAIAFHVDNKL
ncbi:TipAS antibiotic-recognition domain-containing protein [Paenibacillus sp. LHD-38]|uniref:TipAS antibiotic-recognition domain-containing protein n=1 Tax=Paenibacillus sp. LHD-38 TaxID=3072143 RepID=UPI00280C52C2|nr:TipAS antibiotic-recognition domain-containing protein [Paenibacillus sp. LHD-38]MDQ8736620.1 TipAS antibiotic-recognition domain-containing protein [Paenibacillus sp. LHD-38]